MQFNVDGPYPPLEVSATVDRVVLGSAQNTIDVSGTVSCNRDADAYVSGSVYQVRGKRGAEAVFRSGVTCSASPVRWTTTAVSNQGSVAAGVATVTGSYSACIVTVPYCVYGSISTTLQVRAR